MREAQRERVVWWGFPAWSMFSWLYFFIGLTAFRGLLFFHLGLPAWTTWMIGAIILFLVVVLVRYWTYYVLTPTRVIMKNGYTRHDITTIKLEVIKAINVIQGPIARFWGIGTLVIQSSLKGQELRIRGVKDPDVVEAKLRALLPHRTL